MPSTARRPPPRRCATSRWRRARAAAIELGLVVLRQSESVVSSDFVAGGWRSVRLGGSSCSVPDSTSKRAVCLPPWAKPKPTTAPSAETAKSRSPSRKSANSAVVADTDLAVRADHAPGRLGAGEGDGARLERSERGDGVVADIDVDRLVGLGDRPGAHELAAAIVAIGAGAIERLAVGGPGDDAQGAGLAARALGARPASLSVCPSSTSTALPPSRPTATAAPLLLKIVA